ncbi:MAG: T9SS type A sorting domain-containing protein, partial [bacterium]
YLWYLTQDTISHFVHLNGQGQILWQKEFARSGRFHSPFPPGKPAMAVAPDGHIFIPRDDFQKIFKLNGQGQILWQTQVSTRASQAAQIIAYDLFTDSVGGCIVVWDEITNDYVGLRGQRVDRYGNLGGSTPVQDFPPTTTILRKLQLDNVTPNPFTQTVEIHFAVPRHESISLKVYDLLGKEVSTLKNDTLVPGNYSVFWDGRSNGGQTLSSGLYFIVLRSNRELATKKLMFIK